MNKFYRIRLVLRPFQADKALFVCNDEKSAEFFGSRSLLFLEGPYAVRLQRWNDREVYQNNKITCTGGWITVEGLPINLWKNSIFEAIGRRCGGLIDIDVKTSKLQKLFLARIKVKGRTSGFIPASLRINTSSESFLVRLRAISKLRWDRVPAEDPSPINMFAEEDIVVVDTHNDEDDMLTSFGKVEGGNHGVRAKTEPEQMKPGKALSEGHEDFSENESQENEDRESSSSEVVKESNEVEAVCEVGNFFDMYEVNSIANQDQVCTQPSTNLVNNLSQNCPVQTHLIVHSPSSVSFSSLSSFVPNSGEYGEGKDHTSICLQENDVSSDHEKLMSNGECKKSYENNKGITHSGSNASGFGNHEGLLEEGEGHNRIVELEEEINEILEKLSLKLVPITDEDNTGGD
ncbi:hypothetical protein LguiB_008472 [Lonicera macranthoides]